MILVIDAFNLIYKFPEMEELMYRGDLMGARSGLLKKLQEFGRVHRKPVSIHLFIDGKKQKGIDVRRESLNGMEIYYSHDLSADHLIKEFIKRYHSPGELYIVSSDKDIQFYAKKFRCNRFTSEEFAALVTHEIVNSQLPKAEEEKPVMHKKDLIFWRDFFRHGNK